MEPSPESFPKSEVNDEDDDAEIANKAKEMFKRYKSIEQIPTSILNEDPEIKEILEEYLQKRKHKGQFFEEN